MVNSRAARWKASLGVYFGAVHDSLFFTFFFLTIALQGLYIPIFPSIFLFSLFSFL